MYAAVFTHKSSTVIMTAWGRTTEKLTTNKVLRVSLNQKTFSDEKYVIPTMYSWQRQWRIFKLLRDVVTYWNYHSTADTCKNCAECDKGFKTGTSEAYNIKIKIRVGAFRKFSTFVCTPIWLPQTKAFHRRGNSLKSFYLTSWIKLNQWKELTKLIQNYLGTVLIG